MPSTPKCDSSSTTEETPTEDDTPDEILCPAAPDSVAKTSEWTTHGGEGCSYLTKKGEKKCDERHVVYPSGDKVWCEWEDGECKDGGSCGAGGGGGGGDEEPTIEEGKNMVLTELMNLPAINTLINKVIARHGPHGPYNPVSMRNRWSNMAPVSYTHLRAHET